MANSSALSDGAQQANMVSNENAETMFGADQAETNMVTLVDGKLTPMGDTEDDVMDEQLLNRYSSDEERSLQGFEQKTYENSDAAQRASDANYGAPNDRVQTNDDDMTRVASDSTATSSFSVFADMVPTTPSTPNPNNPVPTGPETPIPPVAPDPMPEITPLPGQPVPAKPEIQEPGEPDRSHQIGFVQNNAVTSWPAAGSSFVTATITPTPADQLPIMDDVNPGEAVPGNQYEGMSAGPDAIPASSEDEGMDEEPQTGDSSHPYDVRGDKDSSYQPGERPQETAQMMSQPTETVDESGVKAGEMIGKNMDRSETKSTDGLDRKYNDLDAGEDKTAY